MRRHLHVFLLYLAICCGAAQAGAPDIGIVTSVRGALSNKGDAIALMNGVQEGAMLRIAAGGEVVVFLFPGAREYTLSGPGDFAVSSRGVARTSATGRVVLKLMDPLFGAIATPRAGLVQAGATVRSGAAFIDNIDGSGEAVDPAQPVFRWTERGHIGNYQVMLTDGNGQMLYRTEAVNNQVTPSDTLRLTPGARFWLELIWREPGGQLRLQIYEFSTLNAHQAQALSRLRPDARAPPAARVLFGLWLRSLGAWSLSQSYLAP